MTPDHINGFFESVGGLLLAWNCWRLYCDKQVSGVQWQATAFYMCWGYWNLAYYPMLGQWWSFAGGIGIVSANTVWVSLAVYYTYFATPVEEPDGS